MQIPTADILNASILIVDDQKTNVDLLEELLRDAGFKCIATTTEPKNVCALHRRTQYDLILLDLHMPSMNGFKVMESMRGMEPSGYTPILVITGHNNQKLRALSSGANDFVGKPFNLAELTMRIRNLLEVRLLYKRLDQQNESLKSLALHDELTGLPNRRLLMDRLGLAIAHARRSRCTMAVMFIDLDGFKQINDTFGHDGGDELLCQVAERLMAIVRQEDTVARLGGDEFMIALPELSHVDDAAELGATVIQALSKPFRVHDQDVRLTASVGLSVYPIHGEDLETLMKNADVALYEAKHSGKNSYRMSGSADL